MKSLRKMVKQKMLEAGIDEARTHAHAFRKAVVTEFLRKGSLPSAVSEFVHHKRVTFTLKDYDLRRPEELTETECSQGDSVTSFTFTTELLQHSRVIMQLYEEMKNERATHKKECAALRQEVEAWQSITHALLDQISAHQMTHQMKTWTKFGSAVSSSFSVT